MVSGIISGFVLATIVHLVAVRLLSEFTAYPMRLTAYSNLSLPLASDRLLRIMPWGSVLEPRIRYGTISTLLWFLFPDPDCFFVVFRILLESLSTPFLSDFFSSCQGAFRVGRVRSLI